MAEVAERTGIQPLPDGAAFLREMCARHARVDERGKIVVDLPEQQINALGLFLVQAVFGFFLGLNNSQTSAGARSAVSSSPVIESEQSSQSTL